MSRVANKPITVPTGVKVSIAGQAIDIKGAKGNLQLNVHARVGVELVEGELRVASRDTSQDGNAQAGTTRALLNNMVIGVSAGYQRKLEILGVGYRAFAMVTRRRVRRSGRAPAWVARVVAARSRRARERPLAARVRSGSGTRPRPARRGRSRSLGGAGGVAPTCRL